MAEEHHQQSHLHSSHRGFLLGAGLSILVLVSFFAGAWADRVFVVKPVDYFAARTQGQIIDNPVNTQRSKLSDLLGTGTDLTVADVSEVASESVVTISIKKQQRIIQSGIPGFFGFDPNSGTEQTEVIQQDIGTGFVVDQVGLIVTNKHVVGDVQAEYKVIDRENKEYPVVNMYRDPTSDLAILKIDGANLANLSLGDSSTIRVGEPVIAIGTALGEFRHTVTTGVISGLGRGITAGNGFTQFEALENVIQTDAAINPGNSGGPLLNNKGEVIGVNVAVSANAQNIGFALPINVVKESIDNFNKTGQFDRPFFGVRYDVITEQAAIANELPQGAYVREVVPNSTAAETGMKVGDIITKIDGVALKEGQSLAEIVNKKKIGDTMSVTYWRDKDEQTVTVSLKAAAIQ